VLTRRDVRTILDTDLPVHRLLLGDEFETWAIGDDLVAKFPRTEYDAAKVPMEEAVHPLLRQPLGDLVPAIRAIGEMTPGGFRYIVHERASGIQGQTGDGVSIGPAAGLADDVGRALARLHSVDAASVFALGLGEHRVAFEVPDLDERTIGIATDIIGDRLAAFLREPPPAPSPSRVLCHTDLKGEHVFVSADRSRVRAIIDWADTEAADPALDYAGLVGWLGPRFAAAAIGASGEDDGTLTDRAIWLARAGMLSHWNDVVAGRERSPIDLITQQLRVAFGD
jgi:aminoglycoside phosphotransferase (APT) family kinase protein